MSLKLDQPLGKWYAVKRNTWWSAHKGQDAIYYRGRTLDVLQRFRSDHRGFFSYDGEPQTLPRAPLHNVTASSDGSVHLKDQVAAAAWLIKGDGYAHASACILLSQTDQT